MPFAHLHVHSDHSFIDGVPTPQGLAERVAELGQEACAITDHGEVSGHLKWQKAARKAGIKPIFGMEGYFTDDRRVKEGKKSQSEAYDHITLLAMDEEGLHNLWALSSLAYTEGFYWKPRVDWELLAAHGAGIAATGGCINGAIGAKVRDDDIGAATERISRFQQIFGDRFFLELHTFDSDQQREVNAATADLGYQFGVPLIAVSDCHYLRPGDWKDHELIIALQFNKTHDDPTRYQYGPGQLHVMDEEEVRERLSHLSDGVVDDAVKGASDLADRCDVEIRGEHKLPVFLEGVEEDAGRLGRLSREGLSRRLTRMEGDMPAPQGEYEARLERELALIVDKGFAGYFLIVADVVLWAKGQGILVGPSRGSVGGSLLAWAVGITEIDPIRGGLIFERFLDRGRKSLPDIDLDFPLDERDKVRAYLESRWHVASIGTLLTLGPRVALRDFARVLRIPMHEVNQISKIIAATPDLTVSQVDVGWAQVAAAVGPELKPWLDKYPELFGLVERFQDHVRHSGVHPGGLVVDREPLLGRLPLRLRKDEAVVCTQFDYHDVQDEMGFIKLDVLALRTLSTLREAHDLVTSRGGDTPHFYEWAYDWRRFYEDQGVYESLWDGHNIGVFQLETEGMGRLVKRHKPASMQDLCELVSINRPGLTRTVDPTTGLTLLDSLLARRGGEIPSTVRHEALGPVLGPTYGQFVYQEQVMEACAALCGFTEEEQDRVRKILGHEKSKAMEEVREEFVRRAKEHGVPEAVAASVWVDLEAFGIYGFNKAHGMGYAYVSHWCTWMKHHHPREFMTALMRTEEDKVPLYMREARRLGVPVLGPDVNESGEQFTLTPGGVIRYGLHKVKFVANRAAGVVKRQPFSSLDDFFERIPKREVSKTAMIPLIKVGALDDLVTVPEREGPMADMGYDLPKWIARRYFELCQGGKVELEVMVEVPAREEDQEAIATGEIAEDPDSVPMTHVLRKRPIPLDDEGWEVTEADGEAHMGTAFDFWCAKENLSDRSHWELELLGAQVSVDPFAPWITLMVGEDTYPGVELMLSGETAKMCGLIRRVIPLRTKKGDSPGRAMCVLEVERPLAVSSEGVGGLEEVVCFPEMYAKYQGKIEEGAPVMIRVSKDKRGGAELRQLFRLDQV